MRRILPAAKKIIFLLTVSLNAVLTTFGVPYNFTYLATADAERPFSRETELQRTSIHITPFVLIRLTFLTFPLYNAGKCVSIGTLSLYEIIAFIPAENT